MTWQSRQLIMAEGLDACDRLQPAEEVLEASPDGARIKCPFPAGRSLRVLVADDNRDAADSLSFLVKMWGHDVRQAYDGAAALEMAFAYRPDVLLLDISMPKMDGCRLAQQLRRAARFTDALLIAITGWGDKAHRLIGAEAGFDHFLIKPVDLSILEELLQLQQHRLAELELLSATSRTYRILVVDEAAGVRGALAVGLRHQGFSVWLAVNGREALNLYRRYGQTIDVVLMELRMPGLDSSETLAALQQLNPEIRYCFMSGDTGHYDEGPLRNLSAPVVLRKPFHLAEVTPVLRELASYEDRVGATSSTITARAPPVRAQAL